MRKPVCLLLIMLTSWCPISGKLQAQSPAFVTTVSKCFGGSLQEDFFGGSLCLDGGYLLTGLTNSTDGDINMPIMLDTANIFIVKCDSQGNKQWALTMGGNDYDKARYGIQDADSNFLIVGTTHSNDGDITFTHGNSELFVIKLNASGNLLWMKQYGGTSYESARYITQLNDGNYLITGYTASKNNDVPNNRGGHDGWLLKLDTSGTIIWSTTYGGSAPDRIRHVIEVADGSLIFAGSSESNDFQCTGNHGGTDFWIGKTDSTGNLLWSNLYGGSGEDFAYHITSTSDGAYLATGYSASFDGDVTNNYGGVDGWMIKVDDQGNLVNQRNYGGSGTDRLYKSFETSQGNIITAGFSQSSNYDLSSINAGPSNSYWLVSTDTSLNMLWGYCTGGTGADLGKELIFNEVDSSVVIMGDSNSGNGNVIGNHGDFDFWLVKLDLFTSSPPLPIDNILTIHYNESGNSLLINSLFDNNAEILITDALGKNVLQLKNINLFKGSNQVELDAMGSAATGFYHVRLSTAETNITSKFVKVLK